MSDCVLKIEKLENGYTVEIRDEKIAKANETSKTGWKDPWKEYAFTTSDEVIKFVTAQLTSLPKSAQEVYDEAFKEATKE